MEDVSGCSYHRIGEGWFVLIRQALLDILFQEIKGNCRLVDRGTGMVLEVYLSGWRRILSLWMFTMQTEKRTSMN